MKLNIFLINILGFILFILSCEPPTEAETTGTIEGVIYDASTSQPLGGVSITTEPITSSKISDSNGSFILKGVEPGDYTLQALKSGYQTNSTTIQVVAGETSSADLLMEPLGPELSVSTSLVNFGTTSTSLTFTIQNTGIGTLTWNIVSTANWVAVNPATGSTENESDVVTITVDRTAMNYGNHYETITIASNANSKTIDILMTIQNPNAPQLSVYPISLDFSTTESGMIFNISNTGTGMLTWNITDDKSWISVNPQSGTTDSEVDELVVAIDRIGQTAGTYTGTITISSDGGNQIVEVTFTVSDEPTLSIYPTSLDFGSSESTLTFDVANAGSGDLNWSISDNQSWITTSPSSGTNFSTVNVNISRDGISPGNYSGTVSVSSNGGVDYVQVAMNVPTDEPPGAIVLNDPTVVTTSSIELSWEMSTDGDFASYNLYRSTNSSVSESSTQIAQIVNRYTVEYLDEGLNDGTTYYYRIFVKDEVGQTTGSNTVTASTTNAPGTWGVFATVTVDLNGVSALNDNFVYVVGDSGKIYKWDGSTLSEQSSPTTERLGGVAVIAEDDIWISGEEGVWHNTSGFWVQEAGYPISPCYDMDFVSSDSIWVAGDAEIYFYNGSGWTTISIGSSLVQDINMNNASSGWAITAGAEVYHFNGISWNLLFDKSWNTRSIWGTNTSNVWVGLYWSNQPIRHWTGVEWTSSSINSGTIYDIDGLNENDIWFVGTSSDLVHWNGTELITVLNPSPASPRINMITFISSNSGWGVCDDGVILRYSN